MKSLSRSIDDARRRLGKIRTSAVDIITSVTGNGRKVNTETLSGTEFRELKVMLPYGLSSSMLDRMSVQVVINDDGGGTVVGAYDNARPDVLPGEVILYSNFGSSIKMLSDGNVEISVADGKEIRIGTSMRMDSSGNIVIG